MGTFLERILAKVFIVYNEGREQYVLPLKTLYNLVPQPILQPDVYGTFKPNLVIIDALTSKLQSTSEWLPIYYLLLCPYL